MPTPSEQTRNTECGMRKDAPHRSVFGNYKLAETESPASENAAFTLSPSPSPPTQGGEGRGEEGCWPNSETPLPNPLPVRASRGEGEDPCLLGLNSAIGTAIARSFLHRFIAKAFEDAEREGWQSLCEAAQQESFWSAVRALAGAHLETAIAGPRTVPVRSSIAGGKAQECSRPPRPSGELRAGTARAPVGVSRCAPLAEGALPNFESTARRLLEHLKPDSYTAFESDYITCFGHTVRGDCPMNEIEYGDIKADLLFQPHRLADLGAFYAAFGLEIGQDAAERQDHISIELEFMSVLAAKEAYAIQFDDAQLTLVRDAQKKFLREHLGRWTPAFTRRLSRIAGDGALGALAEFTREFITADCLRFAVTPGSEDLLLRPIDDSLETLCASCGITSLPPGAMSAPVET